MLPHWRAGSFDGTFWAVSEWLVISWLSERIHKEARLIHLSSSMVQWFTGVWSLNTSGSTGHSQPSCRKWWKNWLRRATRLLCPHVAAIFRWGDDWVIFALKQLGISTKRKSNPWIYGCKRWSKGYNQQKLGANNDIISGTGGQNSVLPVVSSTVGTTIDLTWCTEEIPRDNSLSLLV